MAGGRPSLYSEELAALICEQLSEGVPMKRICVQDGMPCYTTVLKWQRENAEFADLSARAKRDGTHALADECIAIADGDEDPKTKRVRIDTRLRLIGKWNSSAYGDKITNEHTGEVKTPAEVVFRVVGQDEGTD